MDRAPSASRLLHLIKSESSAPIWTARIPVHPEGPPFQLLLGMPAGRPGCGQDPSLSLSPVPVVLWPVRGSLTRAGLRACPEGRGSSGRPTSPGRASCPGLGQGRESRESPSCVGSAALVFTCFPLSFSTFPPRSSGCFPNIAAKVNGNPHSAPVRWVACLCSAPWLLRETLVLTRGWGAVGGLPGEGVWPGLE